jgi:hypothetical protein
MFSLCEKCLWKSHHNGKSAPTESNSTHAWNIDGIYPGASYSRSESFTSMSKVDKIFSDSLSEPNLQEIIQEFLYRAEVRRRFVESGYLYD